MADYKLKEEIVQAMQINEADFEAIYQWALSHGKASDKMDMAFSLVHDNQIFRIRKTENSWVLKTGDDWFLISDYRFKQLFKLA